MKSKSSFSMLNLIFLRLDEREEGDFPVSLLGTFQALGMGMMAHFIPAILTMRRKPSPSGSSLILLSQEEKLALGPASACHALPFTSISTNTGHQSTAAAWPDADRPLVTVHAFHDQGDYLGLFSWSFIPSALHRERKVGNFNCFLFTGIWWRQL